MLPVVVLAGGLATRLRPVTARIPKVLIDIDNIPFVLYQLKLMQLRGIKQVHFCLGYLGEQVEKVVKESDFFSAMNITFSYDGDKLLGTGGAIMNAFPFLPEVFFITYGDSYLNISYQDVFDFFKKNAKEEQGLMTIYKNEGNWDKSNVIFQNGKLLLYSKKEHHADMDFIDYGLGVLSKKNFEGFTVGTTFDLAEVYQLLSVKNNLLGYEVFTRFYEIGSFAGIEDFKTHINKNHDL